ncbi:MAG TPA: c-type cytochrome domain-containing protein, partial [Algoriphagus sp.]|nr:c-type cytochrome domain-containing protein [Algoriphagus sp.]
EESKGRILGSVEEAEVFTDVIQPVLKSKCQSCHRAGKSKGELDMSSYESLLKGGENGPVILAANAEKSELIRRVTLPSDHDDFMPAEGKKPLTEEEIRLITWWIEKGNADPKVSLMEADEELIDWAKPKLNILGAEKMLVAAIDTIMIQELEKMGFRVRILSQETGAMDVVLPEESAKGQASELLKELLPIKDQIFWLSLTGTGIQDSDLSIISQFSNLQRLRIENNPITDSGISALKNLTKLEVLNLNGTQISTEGLESIAEIKSLKSLYLWNTTISPHDENVKKMALAEVKVVFGS